jgi:UDP-N-acetylglucosamine 2-epimerase (non-hydrolysing)
MVIFGTRPEAIKMAPIVAELQKYRHELQTCVVVTAQHRSMLDQVLEIFEITPDHDLNVRLPGQTLTEITVRALTGLEKVILEERPDLVLVQGDTTTAFIGGLAAFYQQIPVGHVEAGLRTRDKYNPYPEEMNRHFLDVLSDLYFVPTLTARKALLDEGRPEACISITGNTVIDALLASAARDHQFIQPELRQIGFEPGCKTILVTAHRRENLGAPMKDICLALRDLLMARRDLQVVFPVHPNPKVRETVRSVLGELDRAWLIEPLDYLDFVHLMKRADLVVTDSGGIQEEAPALGKPVLVVRATTERPEAIEAGVARLVGTARGAIVSEVMNLLDDPAEYARMQHAVNPYGDGCAAPRTVGEIRYFFGLTDRRPEPFGFLGTHYEDGSQEAQYSVLDPTGAGEPR